MCPGEHLISRLSLRAQLMVLIAATAVPLAAMLVHTIYSESEQRIANVNEQLRSLTSSLAASAANGIAHDHEKMRELAERPLIRALDAKHCDPLLGEMPKLLPGFASAAVVDIGGNVVCIDPAPRGGTRVSLAKSQWFQRALAQDRFIIGKPQISALSHRWVAVLAQPIHDDNNALKGFLTLALALTTYEPDILPATLAPDTAVGLLTADGVVVWRNLDTGSWVGKNVIEEGNGRQLLAAPGGRFEGIAVDNVPRFYAVEHVPDTDWYAYAGVPSEPIHAAAAAYALGHSLIAVLVLALVTGLALFLARRIERPIRALAQASRAIRNGQPAPRLQGEGAPELIEVADEFNEMITARGRINASLQESEALFRMLVEQAPDAITVFDADLDRYVDANVNAERLFGCGRDELLRNGPQPFLATLQSDTVPAEVNFRDCLARALAGERVGLERALTNAQGRHIICEVRLARLPGERRLIRASHIDITQRKQAEDQLRSNAQELEQAHRALAQREAQLRLVIDNVPAMIAYFDHSSKCVFANQRYATAFGTPLEQLVGKHLVDIFGDDDADARRREGHIRALAGETVNYVVAHTLPSGEVRALEVSLIPDVAADGVSGVYVLLVDVTERERTLRELRDSEQRFRDLTEMSSDWYWEQDEELRFSYLSDIMQSADPPQWERLGKRRWELPWASATAKEWQDHREQLLRREAFQEFVFQSRRGAVSRWLSVSGKPLFDADGKFIGYRGVARDITEKRNAEITIRDLNDTLELRLELRTADLTMANQALEAEIAERQKVQKQLLYHAARLREMSRHLIDAQEAERRTLARELHDSVCSNLTVLGLNVSLVEKRLAAGDVKGAQGWLTDTAGLVKSVAITAREIGTNLHPAEIEYVGLFAAMERYARQFESRTEIAVSVTSTAGDLRLPANQELALFRVFQEAMINCFKHANAKSLAIELSRIDGHLVLAISDDGSGFDLSRVGQRVGQDEQRAGLGLMSMRERVEAIGGQFHLISEAHQGTHIRIELPLSSAEAKITASA